MILKIFRAADAFLYLPTYVAEELGIFKTLLKPFGVDNVKFDTFPAGSDLKAIKMMVDENNNSQDTFSVAIADPIAFLSKKYGKNDYSECRVIGSIINKLPFWAVNHVDKEFSSVEDFHEEFDKVIHYNSNLTTGYFLGSRVLNTSKITEGISVDFGQEINRLKKENRRREKAVAITADVVSLAKGLNDIENPLKINYRFSTEGAYLTTGIITTKKICDTYPVYLSKLLEGIQNSIFLLYASDTVAEGVCGVLVQNNRYNGLKSQQTLNKQEIDSIIRLISEERFYPADLDISREGWNKAINTLGKTELWNDTQIQELIVESFDKYVDNRFIHSSEKSIAKQFGISVETFKDEINLSQISLYEDIKSHQEKSKQLENKINQIHPTLFKAARFLTSIFHIFKRLAFKKRTIYFCLLFGIASVLIYNQIMVVEDVARSKSVFWISVITLLTLASGYIINILTSGKSDE